MRKRHWEFEVQVPPQHYDAILRTILVGEPKLVIRGEHVNALCCGLPKSASLYTTQLLAKSLGMENHPVGFDRAGGSIYYPRMVMAKYRGMHTISHCHNPPDGPTLKLLSGLDLRPVVLTRNLLDALVSRRDMLVRASSAGVLVSEDAVARFLAQNDEGQLDACIDLFAPTFLNFAAGWFQHRASSPLNPVFLTYEEMRADEVGCVRRVAEHLGLPFRAERVREVSDGIRAEGGINFATGVAGRGKAAFNPRQIERLRGLALTIGCVDEEFLGFELRPVHAQRAAV